MYALTSDHAAYDCALTPNTDFIRGGARIDADTQDVTSQLTAICSKRRRRTAAHPMCSTSMSPRISRNAPTNLQKGSPDLKSDSKPRLAMHADGSNTLNARILSVSIDVPNEKGPNRVARSAVAMLNRICRFSICAVHVPRARSSK
jgi:hypothetical protein